MSVSLAPAHMARTICAIRHEAFRPLSFGTCAPLGAAQEWPTQARTATHLSNGTHPWLPEGP